MLTKINITTTSYRGNVPFICGLLLLLSGNVLILRTDVRVRLLGERKTNVTKISTSSSIPTIASHVLLESLMQLRRKNEDEARVRVWN